MGKRDDLIEKYAADIKEHFGESANMDLLKKVTIGSRNWVYLTVKILMMALQL